MSRYLITQTLLSSWGYMFSCYESVQEDAQNDFMRVLNRERVKPTEAMLKGIQFEDAVYAAAAGMPYAPQDKWESGIRKVAAIIHGAPTQLKTQREIEVCGETFLVYGILDALKAGTIYDVKFSTKSFGGVELAGKYLDSPQHPAYLYIVPEAQSFEYLVSDGQDLYREVYSREETRPIGDIIAEFVQSIKDMGLYELYKSKWEAL